MLVDQEGIIQNVNERSTEVFGFKKEEVINTSLFKLPNIPPEKIDFLKERFSKHLKGVKLEPIKLKVSDKSGEEVYIDPRASVISFGGEKIVQISMKDITEKKRAERALKQSEKRYRLITQNINDLIAIVNDRYEYEYINEKMTQKVMGYTKEDIIGTKVTNFIHPEDLEWAKERLKRGFQKGEGKGTIRFLHKDGHWVWLEVKGKTFIDTDGQLKGILISRDISEEVKAKKQLKKSEKKYRQMAELLPDIIYEADINGNLTYVNSIAYETFGYTPEDLEEGINMFDLIHDDYKQKALELREKLLQGGEMEPTEMVLLKKDGSKFYGRFNSKVIYANGEPSGFIGTITDISDLIKTQHELKESKKEYKNAYDRSDFFKNLLAHDIANILNNIELSLNLVNMKTKVGDIPDFLEDSVDMIETQVQKGIDLISDIRKIDKIKSSEIEHSKTNVLTILKDIIDSSSMLNQPDVSITLESDIEEPYVMAGPFLQDAFENVLINGIQHNQSKNRIVNVSISEAEIDNKDYIQIDFEDNGIGIPDKDKNLIFEGKQTLHRDSKGMGLGLSLVQSIINTYNGKISIKNRVKEDYSEGTIFTLSFPAAEA
jgi:PAS domain S-box-containing protein